MGQLVDGVFWVLTGSVEDGKGLVGNEWAFFRFCNAPLHRLLWLTMQWVGKRFIKALPISKVPSKNKQRSNFEQLNNAHLF